MRRGCILLLREGPAMTQTTLSDLSGEAKPAAINSCWNCHNKQDIVMLQGRQMVRCFGSLKPFRQCCSSWSDGKELEHMLRFAAAKEPAQ